jgi:hypothetical protein
VKGPFWWMEEIWPGKTIAILGGGPSLTQAQVDTLRGRCKVIAINDAHRLCSWADLHYFCDARWYGWHHTDPAYQAFAGIKCTLENPDIVARHKGLRMIRNYGWPDKDNPGLCEIRDGVYTGRNSGYQAINISAHLGGRGRRILLGFDMRIVDGKSHWFGKHPRPDDNAPSDFSQVMLPCFPLLLKPLARRGIEIINCTPGSALTCFPTMDLECALSSSSATPRTTAAMPSAAA